VDDDLVMRDPVGMTSSPVLYVIVCACPPARRVDELINLAHEGDWDVCVVTTPPARRFIEADHLAELTGHPIRSEYKHPDEPDVLPPPDGIIVAPATVNTINKWGAGICDTLALGIIVEGIGLKLPIVAVPHSNKAHTAHPAFVENVGRLRSWGVTVLWGDDYPSHDPGTGAAAAFPWKLALDATSAKLDRES
jgi:phosphopantothenoylcysteine synthetase/decarboxylase